MYLKTRRTFLKCSTFSATALILFHTELVASASMLDTLELVQRDLYGDSKDAPSFKEINARAYLSLILTHSRVSKDTKKFIKNGALWLDEEAQKLYKKPYVTLDAKERQKSLESIAQYRWGENWIEGILSFIYEAVLGDTIYGINKNESGWKWLHHASGFPRPKEPLL
jgi:gluconate 2-dehydrogenase gamma chain